MGVELIWAGSACEAKAQDSHCGVHTHASRPCPAEVSCFRDCAIVHCLCSDHSPSCCCSDKLGAFSAHMPCQADYSAAAVPTAALHCQAWIHDCGWRICRADAACLCQVRPRSTCGNLVGGGKTPSLISSSSKYRTAQSCPGACTSQDTAPAPHRLKRSMVCMPRTPAPRHRITITTGTANLYAVHPAIGIHLT